MASFITLVPVLFVTQTPETIELSEEDRYYDYKTEFITSLMMINSERDENVKAKEFTGLVNDFFTMYDTFAEKRGLDQMKDTLERTIITMARQGLWFEDLYYLWYTKRLSDKVDISKKKYTVNINGTIV